MTLFLVYECDSHHLRDSRDLKAIYRSKSTAVKNILKALKEYGWESDVLFEAERDLDRWNQTQGLDENYIIEAQDVGDWL